MSQLHLRRALVAAGVGGGGGGASFRRVLVFLLWESSVFLVASLEPLVSTYLNKVSGLAMNSFGDVDAVLLFCRSWSLELAPSPAVCFRRVNLLRSSLLTWKFGSTSGGSLMYLRKYFLLGVLDLLVLRFLVWVRFE